MCLISPCQILAEDVVRQLDEEKYQMDQVINAKDLVDLRTVSPRILELARRLLEAKGDAAAKPYYEKGLQGNPWALEEQLTFGEILARGGQPKRLKEKAELVLRAAEDDRVYSRAAAILKKPVPASPPPFSELKTPDMSSLPPPIMALVPMDKDVWFLLPEIHKALASSLGIKVHMVSTEINFPEPDRSRKDAWLIESRESIVQNLKQQPPQSGLVASEFHAFLEEIQTNDLVLMNFIGTTTGKQQGSQGLVILDKMIAQLESMPQWEATKVMEMLEASAKDRAGARLLVMGLTSRDLFLPKSNFVFGTAFTGEYIGVVSTHRFLAASNNEHPNRKRLISRLLKQSLSTVGFMVGVPRCTAPDCARAFPTSVAEHDMKPETRCAECQKAMDIRLGIKP